MCLPCCKGRAEELDLLPVIIVYQAEPDDHDAIFAEIDDLVKRFYEQYLFRRGQVALEDRILDWVAESEHFPEDCAEPFRVGDVITDKES